MVHAALYAVGVIRPLSAHPADDGCGGECTAYVTLADVLSLAGPAALAAAAVAALAGPGLARRFRGQPDAHWWIGGGVTVAAYLIGYVGYAAPLHAASADGLTMSWEALLGPVAFSPFLLTALPFGAGAARVWQRLAPPTSRRLQVRRP